MIRAFNALQIVLLFAAMPYIIGWLHAEPFDFSDGPEAVACCLYGILGAVLVTSVFDSIRKEQ